MKLITLLVVIAGVIALAQLAKVGQLTSLIRNKREEDISAADTRLNGGLFVAFMVAFYASFIWLIIRYGDYNPPAASAHGDAYDTLMNFNMYIIMAVFFVVNTVLFLFANKYRQEEGRKATFFAHDNRLELIWTVIPSIVLAVIIIFGLRTWNEMTGEASEDALRVELYSKQFDWTARYAGMDGEFGLANYNLITPTNPLGIVTSDGVAGALEEIEGQIASLEFELSHERGRLLAQIEELEAELHADDPPMVMMPTVTMTTTTTTTVTMDMTTATTMDCPLSVKRCWKRACTSWSTCSTAKTWLCFPTRQSKPRKTRFTDSSATVSASWKSSPLTTKVEWLPGKLVRTTKS